MNSAKRILWAFFFLMPLLVLNTGNVFANITDNTTDDTVPDVTARVARISFLQGEVQIRRAGSDDWERAAKNLPVVEGDEIVTDSNSRLEIQFDTYKYLRLDENAYIKFTALRDEGVAISLPQGSMSLRILEFDKDRSYFEIDAPKTTIAVQKTGMYRIDAGDKNDTEIRVTATLGGQLQVYSENSGFTLKDGRSAKINIAGNYAGEWNVDDASRYADDFDSWTLDRDTAIAKRLRDASYDKYYDRDFYGAEELNENGEWIYTRDYGNVWRPYKNATSRYSDWSPYRYGHWRWVPPYGWTWVNDEDWGWATYHHGRWVSYDNYWVWSPYGQHRQRRSWWRPALVIVTFNGSLLCWYPLPYGYGYYNYNRHYNIRNNTTIVNNTTIINNTTIVNNPTPTPTVDPSNYSVKERVVDPAQYSVKDPRNQVPPTGIIAVDASEFGRAKNYRIPPQAVAKEVLTKVPNDNQSPPILPTYKELNGNISKEILVQNPKVERINTQVKTGATERKIGVPMDEILREQKVYGNRSPIPRTTNGSETTNNSDSRTERKTGAVIRSQTPVKQQDDGNNGNVETRQTTPRTPRNDTPIRSTGSGNSDERKSDSTTEKPRRNDRDNNQTPPYSPPIRQQEPPRENPPERRNDTPKPPREQPQEEQRRSEPRQERQQEQQRSEPRQSESKKEESKPTPPAADRKEKP